MFDSATFLRSCSSQLYFSNVKNHLRLERNKKNCYPYARLPFDLTANILLKRNKYFPFVETREELEYKNSRIVTRYNNLLIV